MERCWGLSVSVFSWSAFHLMWLLLDSIILHMQFFLCYVTESWFWTILFRIHGIVRYAISSQAVVLVCLFFLAVMHLWFPIVTELHRRKLGLQFGGVQCSWPQIFACNVKRIQNSLGSNPSFLVKMWMDLCKI